MLKLIRQRVSLKYLLMTAGTIGGVFTLLYFWVSHRQAQHILAQVHQQAVILHKQIILTRQWVSDHQYVLVAEPPGRLSAPADAESLPIAYTKITPATLTRQLSAYSSRADQYTFNITNFNAKNPRNVPDAFEARALRDFAAGRADCLSRIEVHDGRQVYRYAAPLRITASCLECHRKQDLNVGDIGGCISVLLPFDGAHRAIRTENAYLLAAMLGLTGSVVVVLFLFAQRLMFRPIREIRQASRRLWEDEIGSGRAPAGDELKDFAALCYLVDEKLKHQHEELEEKIRGATQDLHRTNQELARVNRELVALSRSRTEFFSDVSHELRTPLTAIKGAADTLRRKAACTDTGYLDIIGKNTDHLIGIIVDFLDVARLETGNLELEPAEAALSEVITDVIAAQNQVAEAAGVRIVFSWDDPLVLPMDRRRIFQVMTNLVANAIRFSPRGGCIAITMERDHGDARVSVQDEGPGIPAVHHEAVFQKYFRIPEGKRRRPPHQGSSGIGLAVAKGLVEAHGGRIWVARTEGAGSTFRFLLPLAGPPHAPEAGGRP